MEVEVFYAWQSDRPERVNRYLIRDAAAAACERITKDNSGGFVVSLDSDTQGVGGMCDIPQTILDKIDRCQVFLPDLTFVGATQDTSEPQLISNPNVLFELGYAVRSKGFGRVLAVMNEFYGGPKDQMFDVKRRWAIRYSLAEGSDKKTIKAAQQTLSSDMENGLRTIIAGIKPETGQPQQADRFESIRTRFETSVREGKFHDIGPGSSVLAICVAPTVPLALTSQNLATLSAPPPTGSFVGGWNPKTRARSTVASSKYGGDHGEPPATFAISELRADGTIVAANNNILDSATAVAWRRAIDKSTAVLNEGRYMGPSTFERVVINAVSQFAQLIGKVAAGEPLNVAVSLLHVKGYCLWASAGVASDVCLDDDIRPDSILNLDASALQDTQTCAALLRPMFDFIWQEFGFEGSSNYDHSGKWTAAYI
ncbi:MAG TPA: hypothetical protein VNH11_10085 [Pirellulales bacterium]|nr:hypothetical protein [Pirellulales bacterium]